MLSSPANESGEGEEEWEGRGMNLRVQFICAELLLTS